MKKMHALFFLTMIGLCSMAFRPVVVPFEGTIRFETTVTGEAPELLKDRLAKYYDLSFKGNDLKIKGGAPLKCEILLKRSTGKMYIVRTDRKNVYEVDLNDKRIPENTSTPIVTRVKETLTIGGYSCQKYELDYGDDLKLYVWTAQAINVDQLGAAQIFGGQFKLPAEVAGFPLKLHVASPKFTVTCMATIVKATSMDAIEFVLPSGMSTKKL